MLGIDEIALKKGHRDFVAVLTAKTASGRLHILAILPDRLKATVVAWLQARMGCGVSASGGNGWSRAGCGALMAFSGC